MNKIDIALIPAGGFGTRFLPTTKSIPKEMFPLGSKPIILHVVEEVVKSGIKKIIIVTSREKKSLESFFKHADITDDCLQASVKIEQAEALAQITKMADIEFVYTGNVCGNAASLVAAKDLIGGRPFALLWSDEIILSKDQPRLAQCLDVYERYGHGVISAVKIADPARRHMYGMAELKNIPGQTDIKQIVSIVEKPAPGTEPSPYAAHGAYILPGDIFDMFKDLKIRPGSEISLPAIVSLLIKDHQFLAKIIKSGVYLDCGNPLAYVCSQIEYGLKFGSDAKALRAFIKTQI